MISELLNVLMYNSYFKPTNFRLYEYGTTNGLSKLQINESKDEVENYCEKTSPDDRKHEIIWFNVIGAIITHMIVFYGLYLSMTSAHIFTTIQVILLHFVGMFGITGGCHRLWSHRAYKAKLPLRIILMLCSTLAFQGSIFQWARDHRVHHKCSDTHGDPHNPSVGFFFHILAGYYARNSQK
ncbi:hypothetical protein WA026_009198 [Henosepilachna vigintioctopunctata]|uniref:Uncharacterized protein n=1 Tax=Henosepilachna vigintioctopunctata TaxID=420089 RepID=A0AAW1UQ60_9CUCU